MSTLSALLCNCTGPALVLLRIMLYSSCKVAAMLLPWSSCAATLLGLLCAYFRVTTMTTWYICLSYSFGKVLHWYYCCACEVAAVLLPWSSCTISWLRSLFGYFWATIRLLLSRALLQRYCVVLCRSLLCSFCEVAAILLQRSAAPWSSCAATSLRALCGYFRATKCLLSQPCSKLYRYCIGIMQKLAVLFFWSSCCPATKECRALE